MPKPDFLKMSRPVRVVQTKTFTDPDQPGKEVTLSLRKLDTIDAYAAVELAQQKKDLYLGSDAKDADPPAPFPYAPNGETVELNALFVEAVSQLVCNQSDKKADGTENDELYTFEEFVLLNKQMPNAWRAINEFANAVNEDVKPNPPADSGATSSPSESAPATATPNLIVE